MLPNGKRRIVCEGSRRDDRLYQVHVEPAHRYSGPKAASTMLINVAIAKALKAKQHAERHDHIFSQLSSLEESKATTIPLRQHAPIKTNCAVAGAPMASANLGVPIARTAAHSGPTMGIRGARTRVACAEPTNSKAAKKSSCLSPHSSQISTQSPAVAAVANPPERYCLSEASSGSWGTPPPTGDGVKVYVLSLEELQHEHVSQGHQAYNTLRTKHGMPIVDKSMNPQCDACLHWKMKAIPQSRKSKTCSLVNIETNEVLQVLEESQMVKVYFNVGTGNGEFHFQVIVYRRFGVS